MKNDTLFVNVFPTNDRQRNDFHYRDVAQTVVNQSLDLGMKYTLITVGDKRIDPWVMAQVCMEENQDFTPLIAVNPFYQHPVNIAKKIISLEQFFKCPVAINLVTGSFFGELKSVNDVMDFSERRIRLREFYEALTSVLFHQQGYKGKYYSLNPAEIYPRYSGKNVDLFVSGAMTDDFTNNANAYFVRSIRPLLDMEKASGKHQGLALGLCVRDTEEQALSAVKSLYPEDRKGEMLFSLSLANNLTPWNIWLKNYLQNHDHELPQYYLNPMKYFWGSTPFLVGNYKKVAELLREYRKKGYDFFILDYLPEEGAHVKKCLDFYRNLE